MDDAAAEDERQRLAALPELLHLRRYADATAHLRRRSILEKLREAPDESLVELFDENKLGEWPTQCTELCRWDLHHFDSFPIGIPVRFDEMRYRMVMRGYFCSFACASAYCRENQHVLPSTSQEWLHRLAVRAFGLTADHIVCAPPREFLNDHNIEEFRALSAVVEYAPLASSRFYEREREYVQEMLVYSEGEGEEEEAVPQQSVEVPLPKPKRRRLDTPTSLATVEKRTASKKKQGGGGGGVRRGRMAVNPLLPTPPVVEEVMEKRQKTGVLHLLGAIAKKPPPPPPSGASSSGIK